MWFDLGLYTMSAEFPEKSKKANLLSRSLKENIKRRKQEQSRMNGRGRELKPAIHFGNNDTPLKSES